MKRAVGVHFGHDAGIAVVSENGIEKFLSKERISRFKHALGWDFSTVEAELSTNLASPIGLSATQDSKGIITEAGGRLWIKSKSPRVKFGSQVLDPRVAGKLLWARNRKDVAFFKVRENWNSKIITNGQLRYTNGLRNLKSFTKASLHNFFDYDKDPQFGIADCTVKFENNELPAAAFMHHLAHAYYAFWASRYENALIVSHDGGSSPNWPGGGYFWGSREAGVQPLLPGGFWMGRFYDATSAQVGVYEPGRLMGLAPYGSPRFYHKDFVGSIGDIESRFGFRYSNVIDRWLKEVCKIEKPLEWDIYSSTPPQLAADIAASAQKILEENILANVETGLQLTRLLGKPVDGVVLVGGVALNCPVNTLIYQQLGQNVFIPPACSDEGLALGTAVGTYYHTYGAFPPAPADPYEAVYLGSQYSDANIQAAVAGLKKVSDFDAASVAQLLKDGAIVGLFHGRSEIGPRALGHRSILASPLIAENWLKVNAVKGREPWRPFAPICLEEDMHLHFKNSDLKSRYMLFTHKVIHDKLPAITHVDGSARAQAATASCGIVYDILKAFKAETGYGVLMNTSFNGKGVPIVETPQDAVTEAERIGLDFFVCEQGLYKVRAQS